MRAIQYQSSAQPAAIMEIESPSPQGTDVLLDMQYSALNHRDIFITKGLYPNLQAGVILGSDGVGIWDNKPYLINPNINWGTDPRLPEDDYTILGMPCNGTFCEQMVTAPDRLVEMPSHLTLAQAASLPLAGLTAYRVLFSRCQLTKQDRVCVSGIGGGVAIFVLQFALAQGAEVWVTSSSHTKIEKAIEMGAAGGFLYSDDNWHKSMKKSSGALMSLLIVPGVLVFRN